MMSFLNISHAYIVNSSSTICMGYPDSRVNLKPLEQYYFMSLKKYTMPSVQMFVDEIIPINLESFSSNNLHQFAHRYIISSSKKNGLIELLFFDLMEWHPVNETTPSWRQQLLVRHCDSIRNLWTSPNLGVLQEQFNNSTILSEQLKQAAICYFQAIHSFGNLLYMEPLTNYNTIISPYNYLDKNQHYIGYSATNSRVYQGINTATKKPCLARIELSHAYILEGKQKYQLLGMMAISDLKQLQQTLRKCNSVGTIDFASVAILNFTTSARQLFDVSPVFVESCENNNK